METRKRKSDEVSPEGSTKKSSTANCSSDTYQEVKIVLKNEVAERLGNFEGEYKQSSILWHGNPCFIQNEINAIWYYKKRNIWIIGAFQDIGSGRGGFYTEHKFGGGPTDDRNVWYYACGNNEWALAASNDIVVKFIMSGQQENPTDFRPSMVYHSQPNEAHGDIVNPNLNNNLETEVIQTEKNLAQNDENILTIRKKDYEDVVNKNKAFESRLITKTREFALAQNSLKSSNNKISTLSAENREITEELTKLRNELAKKEEQLQANKVQIDNQNNQCLNLKTKNNQFYAQIISLQDTNKRILESHTESMISDLKEEITVKIGNIQSLEKACLEATTELRKVKNDNQTKQVQIEHFEKQIENLRELINEHEHSEAELKELRANLEKEIVENIAIESKKQIMNKVEEIRLDYESQVSKRALDHSAEIASYKKYIEQENLKAKSELEKMKNDNQTKLNQIEDLEKEKNGVEQELKKVIVERNEYFTSVKEEKSSLQKKLKSQESQVENFEAELKELKENLEKEINSKNIALESKEQATKKMEEIKQDYESKISCLELDHTEIIASYQKEIEISKASLENVEKVWQTKLSDHLIQKSELILELNKIRDEFNLKFTEMESLKTQSNSVQTDSHSQNHSLDQKQKYKKLRHLLATKVFTSDSENEDLETLLNLDIIELFNKYERVKTNVKIKIEDSSETVNDIKEKLKIQFEKRELYEKEYDKIMKVLNITGTYTDILPKILELKNYVEQNEEEHYTNAVEKLS